MRNQFLRHQKFSKINLIISALVFAFIGGYIIWHSFAATSPAPVGVVFVCPASTDCSDTNTTYCKNYATPPATYPSGGCATWDKANQLLACNQIGEIYAGTYSAAMSNVPDRQSCPSDAQNATLQVRPDALVKISGPASYTLGTRAITIKGEPNNLIESNPTLSYFIQGEWPNDATNLNFSSGATHVIVENVHVGQATMNGTYNILRKSELGPCIAPSYDQVKRYFARQAQVVGCTPQMFGDHNTIDKVTFHDISCLGDSSTPDGVSWCNPPGQNCTFGVNCPVYTGACPIAPSTCYTYGNGFHSDGIFIRHCVYCTFSNNLMYHNGVTNIRLQDCCQPAPPAPPILTDHLAMFNNIWMRPMNNADPNTPMWDGDPINIDTPMPNMYVGFNTITDICTGSGYNSSCPAMMGGGTVAGPALWVGNFTGLGAVSPLCGTSANYYYNVMMRFSQFSPGATCPGGGNVVAPAFTDRYFKFVNSSDHWPAFDPHLQTSSPARSLVPTSAPKPDWLGWSSGCPPTDYYGNPRPQGAGQFCDAGAVQTTGAPVTPPPPPPPTSAPTVSLTALPTSITSGQSSTLTWSSTNATTCTASGAWSGTKATSGSVSAGNLTVSSTYTLTCTGTGGTRAASASVTVNGLPPPPPPPTPPPPPPSTTKTGDLNKDSKIDIFDLSILLSNYSSSNVVADIDKTGKVDVIDLSILLTNYGK